LKLLGIEDVQEKGGADEEDLIFHFKHVSEFKSGVIEVHGTEGDISLSKLVQCHRWVDNHLMTMSENVKGIVILNQHILEPYPERKDDRMKLEPNQIDYAKRMDMCIIPSCILFEAVDKTLAGNKPSRETLERIIANSKDVINALNESGDTFA
jgi:hypothetical protein